MDGYESAAKGAGTLVDLLWWKRLKHSPKQHINTHFTHGVDLQVSSVIIDKELSAVALYAST